MKIYAVTPNPALDLSGHVSRILPNEKNYVTRARVDPGGNGINAARIAKRLGASTTLLGFAGGGAGEQLRSLLDKEGLKHRLTLIRANTRTNVTVTNDQDHKQTRLTFPGPTITPTEIRSLEKSVLNLKPPGILILGGSIPKGCSAHFYSDLIRIGMSRKLGIIVDVPAVYLKRVIRSSSEKLLFLKPNLNELESLFGQKFRSDAAVVAAALKLSQKSALVCVSLAERGAIFAANGQAWSACSPHIKAKGSVGAGDSMVGAIASRLVHWRLVNADLLSQTSSQILHDVFRWGVAAGAATAATEGTTLGHPAFIRRLSKKVKIKVIHAAD